MYLKRLLHAKLIKTLKHRQFVWIFVWHINIYINHTLLTLTNIFYSLKSLVFKTINLLSFKQKLQKLEIQINL